MRYPLEPLMAAAGIGSMAELRRHFPMNGTEYRRVLDQGLTERQADRWSVRLGLHPSQVWADWFRFCPECGEQFTPKRRGQRFCVLACYRRQYQRSWQNARYQSDPEFAARERERAAARYAQKSTRPSPSCPHASSETVAA